MIFYFLALYTMCVSVRRALQLRNIFKFVIIVTVEYFMFQLICGKISGVNKNTSTLPFKLINPLTAGAAYIRVFFY